MSVTFTDFFCGFGGSSIGLTEAGMQLVWAANHWDRAIETHAANFRDADHFQGDISGYDMRKVPRADVAWISPECTWHSPAGGRKRLRADLDLFDDYVPDAAGERSRATMWDVVRAAEAKQFKVVIVENVVEVTTWPLFETWLAGMETLGYEYQILCVSAAHVGGPRNPYAPQWRDRIYFVFSKRGIPMPDVAPHPVAWCSQCEADVESVQSWKRTDRRRIGKYGAQYVYVCSSDRHPAHVVEPYVLPAAAAIDWSDLGIRIGDRDKPLAAATMRRIEAGIRMFARPTVVAHSGETWDAANPRHPRYGEDGAYLRAWPADESPLMARSSGPGDGVAVPPFVANVRHGADDHGRQYLPDSGPMPTAQTKIGDGLVSPPMIVAALGAVTAGGNHHGLTVPDGAFIQKHHGGLDYNAIGHMVKSVDEPLPSIVARANTSLVIPYRRGSRAYGANTRPLHTVSTIESAALLFAPDELAEIVENSRFRMLGPREHLRAQRFPDSYIVLGNKGEQTKGAGNAVASNVAHYLGAIVMLALGTPLERAA